MNSLQNPTQAKAENATRAPSARFVRWRTPLVGTLMGLIMLGLGSFVVLMSQHLAQEQAQKALERSLLRQAQDIVKFRNFYASEIMAPAQAHGVRGGLAAGKSGAELVLIDKAIGLGMA